MEGGMKMRRVLAFAGVFTVTAGWSWAGGGKATLPTYVLRARTVAVMVDPNAGFSLEDPNANQTAQKDVETALLNWGRFHTVMGPEQADLVIVLKKGTGKLVSETITNPRANSRAGVINPTADGVSIGAQHGRQPALESTGAADGTEKGTGGSHPQMEVGSGDDSFVVYEGQQPHAMDGIAAWRWVKKNALHPHDVPAVEEFRKAIVEAEKAAAKQAAAKQAGKKP
jgi:hypothetical protein